jgi:hypothetical protein
MLGGGASITSDEDRRKKGYPQSEVGFNSEFSS